MLPLLMLTSLAADLPPRRVTDLAGIWEIRADGDDEWLPIAVPASWETVLGVDFDGVAWYRRTVPLPADLAGRRVLLRFWGAATEATVWLNEVELGSHLGAWTPFTFDLTPHLVPGEPAALLVRLDEQVGHNTQGFLPVIAPHFGGLWQGVELLDFAGASLDETAIAVTTDFRRLAPNRVALELTATVPIHGELPPGAELRLQLQGLGPAGQFVADETVPAGDEVTWRWSGEMGYTGGHILRRPLHLTLQAGGQVLDEQTISVGFRSVVADGHGILLNGEPLVVRGVLHWGYNPPQLDPNLDPERFREQLRELKACGFNLIKFCLWVPPKALLEVCDEERMLVWIEYPTWHPTLDQAHRAELLREYTEFLRHDRNQASVILRSITCETGPTADLEVLQSLYDLCKQMAPGTLVEDDSSWIGWNRIHDFWDDHSYGNNRWWRGQLGRLRAHIDEHGVKPLLLGEAITADTWPDTRWLLNQSVGGRPWWLPKWLDSQLAFEQELQARWGGGGYDPVADLRAWSLEYAMTMRRWQIETYREMLPDAGYVVSVMSDFTGATMGLYGYDGAAKWSEAEWETWHLDPQAALRSPGDQRAYRASQPPAAWPVRFTAPTTVSRFGTGQPDWQPPAEPVTEVELPAEPARAVARPELVTLAVTAKSKPYPRPTGGFSPHGPFGGMFGGGSTRIPLVTEWPLWALPDPAPVPPNTILHGEPGEREPATLFPGATALPPEAPIPAGTALVVTTALSGPVLDYLEAGGRVLHLTSSQRGSWRDEGTWWLRGTVWSPPRPTGFADRVPGELLRYLQLFELGGNTCLRGERLWREVDPLLMFVETHDLDRVRPNLLLFDTRVGAGRLAVSCLRHEGGEAENYAGLWLARELAAYLLDGPPPERELSPEVRDALRTALDAEIVKLETPWRFVTDPAGDGLERGYERLDCDDGGWRELLARSPEEGAIWNAYDGWGWYRQRLTIPGGWAGKRIRLVFDSVDDMYELYVNGRLVGGYGKLDRSESSFLRRTWQDITPFVEPGGENLVVVRVYDWVGAGGLNGEAWLTTGPVEEGLDFLRR